MLCGKVRSPRLTHSTVCFPPFHLHTQSDGHAETNPSPMTKSKLIDEQSFPFNFLLPFPSISSLFGLSNIINANSSAPFLRHFPSLSSLLFRLRLTLETFFFLPCYFFLLLSSPSSWSFPRIVVMYNLPPFLFFARKKVKDHTFFKDKKKGRMAGA